MKILAVHQGGELYGSDRSFLTSVEALKKNHSNYKIDVILHEDGPLRELLLKVADSVEIRKISKLSKADIKGLKLGFIWNFIKNVSYIKKKSREYDVFYINTIVILDFILMSRFVKNSVKSVIHIREIQEGTIGKVFRSLLIFSKAHLIFNSRATKDSFISKQDESFVAFDIIDNGLKGYVDIPTPSVSDHLNILLLGRINNWKGQDFMINVISGLQLSEKEKISFRIVGGVYEGQEAFLSNIKGLIESFGLENIEILPFTDDITGHLEWSNLVVVPSTRPEPFGRVSIEAMSASRTVVVSNHGGLAEIVDHKINGLKFEPNDLDDARECLRYLLGDPKSLIEFGIAGKKKFISNYSGEVFANYLNRVFEKLNP